MSTITLTTDFGTDSPYVAAMKGVILSINPDVTLVDVTHSVPAQDIRAGAVILGDAFRWFPESTIHVAVVDPGVGTRRRIVCIETGGHRLVGPDNGVLAVAIGGARDVHAFRISQPRFRLPEVSRTFHGRDVMAPAAAHLSLGVRPGDLGPPIDDWVRLELPEPSVGPGRIEGEVLYVDSFGNLITNISVDMLGRAFGGVDEAAASATVICGRSRVRGLVRAYAEAELAAQVALIGSSGRLEVAVVCGNAESSLAVGRGERVIVEG
jgi:S-adenosylmethionine hydrolase